MQTRMSTCQARLVIKVLYQMAGSPPEEDWGERDGRRKTKSGSCDPESAWCKAGFNQAKELSDRFRRGAALRGSRPQITVGNEVVSCALVDPWCRSSKRSRSSTRAAWCQILRCSLRWLQQAQAQAARCAIQLGDEVARDLRARARRAARDEKAPQGAQSQSQAHGWRVSARV